MRLTKPAWVSTTTVSSAAGRSSSTTISSKLSTSSVRRGSAKRSRICPSSFLMTPISLRSLPSIAFRFAISFVRSSYSLRSDSTSKLVSRCSRMSRIAWAWISVSAKRAISFSRASFGVLLPRMSRMTSSRLSTAMIRPSRMWARASACCSSYFVRRVTTFFWWAM